MKCLVCNTEIEGKAKTCSSKCRKALSRSVTQSVTNVTESKCDNASVTDFEKCRYCDCELPRLMKLRRSFGSCLDCATSQVVHNREAIQQIASESIYSDSYRLTDLERFFYKSIRDLKKATKYDAAEVNFVAKPGYACYGG